jgi:hypothetical protein
LTSELSSSRFLVSFLFLLLLLLLMQMQMLLLFLLLQMLLSGNEHSVVFDHDSRQSFPQ